MGTGQALDLVNPSVHSGMYLYDGIGNPVGLLTDTGTRAYDVSFDPYGVQTINAGGSSDWYGNTPYGFKAGTRTNGDALVKFGLRWYLPTTGTWTQRDTLDAPLDPNNANRYAYAGDDPVNKADIAGSAVTHQGLVNACGLGALGAVGLGLAFTPEASVFAAVGEATLGCAGAVYVYVHTEEGDTEAADTLSELDATRTYLSLLRDFF